uniref:Uncharacterized protein n=1 Tax=Cacopsylla melanoneura TaxID=428564 RepID=A0A8D8WYI8_9HEMI
MLSPLCLAGESVPNSRLVTQVQMENRSESRRYCWHHHSCCSHTSRHGVRYLGRRSSHRRHLHGFLPRLHLHADGHFQASLHGHVFRHLHDDEQSSVDVFRPEVFVE